MSRITTFTIVLVALLLAACATTSTTLPGGSDKISYRTDSEYVAQVESQARRRGIHVVWVNPPQQRVINREQE